MGAHYQHRKARENVPKTKTTDTDSTAAIPMTVTLVRRNRQKAPGIPGGSGAKEQKNNFDFFFEKNDPISSKIHLRNHNKKDKKLCSIVIEHIEMISEWCINSSWHPLTS